MKLGEVLADWRYAQRIGVRDAAKMIGISSATLNRIENDGNADAQTLAKILCWLMDSGETRRQRATRSDAP